MISLLKHMERKQLVYGLFLIIFIVSQVVMELTVPDYMSKITKLINTQGSTTAQIMDCGKMMLLFSSLAFVSSVTSKFFSSKLAASFSKHLRYEIFKKVESFSMEEMDRFSTASLITRSTNDCTQIQNIMSRGVNQLIRVPIMIGFVLYKISTHYWQWMAFTAASVSVLVFLLLFLIFYAHPRFRKMQYYTDNINQVTRENMTGMRVVRAYNGEAYEERKFDKANDEYTDNALKARRAMGLMQPVTKFVNNELNVGIYCIGAFLIASANELEKLNIFSEMVVFSTYAAGIVRAFMGLNMVFNMIPRATVSAERINEILDCDPKIKDGNKETESEISGVMEFKNVSFSYVDSSLKTLDSISFSAKKGETIALIGPTGSGKSTIVNLMMRFIDCDEGEILVDGKNVKDYPLDVLRKKMGYASQQAVLFTGTVSSNVAYATQIIEEKVNRAIEIAQSQSFVSAMEKGINAPIRRGGTNISGGQKQRLSIARAIYRQPEFYIFDDTFSALDYRTDAQLRMALKKQTASVTTFIVAQRISTIKDADKILVIDEGKIVGQGKHEELMESCQLYREIAYTQLSKEEML